MSHSLFSRSPTTMRGCVDNSIKSALFQDYFCLHYYGVTGLHPLTGTTSLHGNCGTLYNRGI